MPMLRRVSRFLLVILVLLYALPASAVDNVKLARSLAQQAAKAYEAADFTRAAQLYLDAWKADGSKPAYLYGAARAEHLGGQLDRAAEHYTQFMALPGADADKIAKVGKYLEEVQSARADARTLDADTAMRTGDPRLAAHLYLDA